MKTLKYFSKAFQVLRHLKNKENKVEQPKNELIHPRFEITKNDPLAQKKVPNSLLFLMYSKENEELFI
jgi:hypothetical protein